MVTNPTNASLFTSSSLPAKSTYMGGLRRIIGVAHELPGERPTLDVIPVFVVRDGRI